MDSSSNHYVGQEVDEGLFVGGIPKESFLGHGQAHFFDDRHCCVNVVACSTSMGFRVDVQLSKSLLFLHAISGCDTTSRPHGIGKVGVLKKYAALAESAATFMASESSKVVLDKAGERALLIMYGSQVEDLKTARLQKFQTKVATAAGYVPPEKLPPTSDAARFYSHRVFLQIQAWKGNDLSP